MEEKNELQQRLWEYAYGLSSEEESEELCRRICSDPDVARAYAEVKLRQDLVARAARRDVPAAAAVGTRRPRRSELVEKPVARATGGSAATRAGGWLLAACAAALLCLAAYARLHPDSPRNRTAAANTPDGASTRIVATAPALWRDGTRQPVTVHTTSIDGSARSVPVRVELLDEKNRSLHVENVVTDSEGTAKVELPAKTGAGRTRLVVRCDDGSGPPVDTLLARAERRYDTRISTDRTVYQPGESIRVRSVTLSRSDLRPSPGIDVRFRLVDATSQLPVGAQVEARTINGICDGLVDIPDDALEGPYRVVASSPSSSFELAGETVVLIPPESRRLMREIEFVDDQYVAGQTVEADLAVRRPTGQPAAKATVEAEAIVDGKRIWREQYRLDAGGTSRIKFGLPEDVEGARRGALIVRIDDDGIRGLIHSPIPLRSEAVRVDFLPEGGRLAAGVENRVFFRVADAQDSPLDLRGRLVDDRGRQVAAVETEHAGFGTFRFTPDSRRQYRLVFRHSTYGDHEVSLPKAEEEAFVAIDAGSGVFSATEPLRFRLRSREANVPLIVVAQCRGVTVAQQRLTTSRQPKDSVGKSPTGKSSTGKSPTEAIDGVEAESAARSVSVPLDPRVGGVVRLTVFDARTAPPRPIADRLVYRHDDRVLNVKVVQGEPVLAPGSPVDLKLLVTDERGRPAPATLAIGVTDRELADPLNVVESSNNASHELAKRFAFRAQPTTWDRPWGAIMPRSSELLSQLGDTPSSDGLAAADPIHERGLAVDRGFAPSLLAEVEESTVAPLILDNRSQLESLRGQELSRREAHVRLIGQVLLVGGIALLTVLILQKIMMASSWRLWVPSMMAACLCLIAGSGWQGAELKSDILQAADSLGVDYRLSEVRVARLEETARAGIVAADAPAVDPDSALPSRYARFFASAPMRLDGFAKRSNEAPTASSSQRLFIRVPRANDAPELGASPSAGLGTSTDGSRGVSPEPYRVALSDTEGQSPQGGRFADLSVLSTATADLDDGRTLYWHPRLTTDAEGSARVRFELADRVGTFDIHVEALAEGKLGYASGTIESRLPFKADPKLPLEVATGDLFDVPLSVRNTTDRAVQLNVSVGVNDLLIAHRPPAGKVELLPGEAWSDHVSVQVGERPGTGSMTFSFAGQGWRDSITKKFEVRATGFPTHHSVAGILKGTGHLTIPVPDDVVAGSAAFDVQVFPSPLADLHEASAGLGREAAGNDQEVESKSTYLDLLAYSYIQNCDIASPEVTRRAKRSLREVERLTMFGREDTGERKRSIEEVLSAMELDSFHRSSDEEDGAAAPSTRERFTLQPDAARGGAVARESRLGESRVELARSRRKEIVDEASRSEDPYVIARGTIAQLEGAATDTSGTRALLKKLEQKQREDGRLSTASAADGDSRSDGRSSTVETTALAALAWMKSPDHAEQASKAVNWLVRNRQTSGGFGSPRATVLALKAIVEHARSHAVEVRHGNLLVYQDGVPVGRTQVHAEQKDAVTLRGPLDRFDPGEVRLSLELTNRNELPYVMDVSYRRARPDNDARCPLALTTTLSDATVAAGGLVSLNLELENRSGVDLSSAAVAVGLPAGLAARSEQLEESVAAGRVDAFETRARQLLLHWDSLAAEARGDQRVMLTLDLIAEIPGTFTGPASCAYLIDRPEQKVWSDPIVVEIRR